MLKFLKGVVGSGGGIKDLPYNIGEPYSTAWGGWTHCRGTSKVNCFVLCICGFDRPHTFLCTGSCSSPLVFAAPPSLISLRKSFSRAVHRVGDVQT